MKVIVRVVCVGPLLVWCLLFEARSAVAPIDLVNDVRALED